MDVPSLPRVFFAFLRVGAVSFGGPAMVAYIRKMAVEEKQWLDEASFRDGVALCQAIPGAAAMQTAAYVGLRARGLLGAAACFGGFGLPAFLMMMALSSLYLRGHALPMAVSALAGLGAVVVAIVANAAVTFGTRTLVNWRSPFIALAAAVLLAALMGLALFKARLLSSGPTPAAHKFYSTRSLSLLLVLTVAGLILLFIMGLPLFKLAVLMFRIDLLAVRGRICFRPYNVS